MELGKPAVEPLVQVLKDKKELYFARKQAAEALGEIGDARAIEPLKQALNDGEVFGDHLQVRAKEALEKIKTKKS